MNDNEAVTIDLREVWRIIVKNIAIVRNWTILCLIAAGAYLAIVPSTYESVALLRVKPDQGLAVSALGADPLANANNLQQLMNTYVEVLKSRKVMEPVVEELNKKRPEPVFASAEALIKSGAVQVRLTKNSQTMSIIYSANSPEEAYRGNKIVVQQFLKRLTDLAREKHKERRVFLEERIVNVKKELKQAEHLVEYADNSQVGVSEARVKAAASKDVLIMLTKRLEEAKVAEGYVVTDVSVIDDSTVPTTRSKPRRALTMVLALVLGILSSSAFVIAKEMLNMKVRSSEDVERYLGLPILGQVPDVQSLSRAENEANMGVVRKFWRALWGK